MINNPQPYTSFSHFCLVTGFRIPGRLKGHWRLTKRFVAHPAGLSNLHGLVVATDGILAAIERSDGMLVVVHKEWLEPEQQEQLRPEHKARTKQSGVDARTKRTGVDTSIYV